MCGGGTSAGGRAKAGKGGLLRLAAHGLRGPLTGIAGYLTMLADRALGRPPEKWREPLGILSVKTAELNRIMDDLLEVSRMEAEPVRAHEPVDLRNVIRDAAERARPRLELAGGTLEADPGTKPLVVDGDSLQLGRIVDNLLNNGLSYTTSEPRLKVTGAIEGGRMLIRVKDNGIGIAGEDRERLFEPFRRGRGPATEQVPGTGLGLYIARKLAQEHGGTVLIELSVVGEGSTFTLSLPPAAASPATAPIPGQESGRGRLGVQSE